MVHDDDDDDVPEEKRCRLRTRCLPRSGLVTQPQRSTRPPPAMLRKRLNLLSGTTMSHTENTSASHKGKGKSSGHGQRGDLSSFPSVTERYSEPESGFGSSDEEDEEVDEEQALEFDDEDKDEEVHDPYTDEEEDEEVLSDASGSRSSHTSRARSPDPVNSTASSRTARSQSAP
jgi:hypothetical protein